ncbi:MAG: AAA family ATPase [Eubacteriales bacterium]|nr:AAA family ATPase [Eubacteriales bacterium]
MDTSQIRKIVITGGPCAGKTTGMSWIQNTFEKMGYIILFVSEPATEMKTAGITPARCSSSLAYQEFQMKLQLEKEKVFAQAALDISRRGTPGYVFRGLAEQSVPGRETQTLRETDSPGTETQTRKLTEPDSPGREEKEGVAARNAQVPPETSGPVPRKVLIVCDRGFFDNRAYMSEEEFAEALRVLGVTAEEMLRNYDAVFHLETTAKNASVFYGTQTNAIRDETPEEAAALDDRTIAAWREHPYFRVIENLNGFENKMRRLIAEIAAFLGEPVPYEFRRRYLIEYPDPDVLEGLADCHRVQIEQVYLRAGQDEEVRVRRRKSGDDEVFYLTRYKIEGGRKRLEAEGKLSAREYQRSLGSADPSIPPVQKTRYCLTWQRQYYEIDLYPFWTDRAVLEVSLREEREEVKIPPFLHVLKEVTGDEEYEVSVLARRQSGGNERNDGAASAGPVPRE